MNENEYDIKQVEHNLPPEHLVGVVTLGDENIQVDFPGAHVLIRPTGLLSKDELLNLSNLMAVSAVLVPDLLRERDVLMGEKSVLLSTISFLAEMTQRALGNDAEVDVKINNNYHADTMLL